MDSKKIQKIFGVGFIAIMLLYIVSVALVSLLMGLWLLAYAVWHINKINDIKKSGIRVEGYIVSYEKDADGDDIPIFQFVTVTREIITGKPLNQHSVSKDHLLQNEKLSIIYELHNPSEFVTDNGRSAFGINLVFILVALTFIIFGLFDLLHIIHINSGHAID